MSGPTIGVPARTEQEWAAIINADLGRAVEGVVAAGKHLVQARCQLGRGRFGDMLRAANLHERTAERLMRIAESPVLTDPAHAARLPVSMRTLAELTRFPSPILKGYLEDGTINVATERADVEKLLGVRKPTRGSGSKSSRDLPAESWAQSKPPVERMEAKQAENAEQEAQAQAEADVLKTSVDAGLVEKCRALETKCAALETENEELRARIAELEAELEAAIAQMAPPEEPKPQTWTSQGLQEQGGASR
jgi:hypothetical protein